VCQTFGPHAAFALYALAALASLGLTLTLFPTHEYAQEDTNENDDDSDGVNLEVSGNDKKVDLNSETTRLL